VLLLFRGRANDSFGTASVGGGSRGSSVNNGGGDSGGDGGGNGDGMAWNASAVPLLVAMVRRQHARFPVRRPRDGGGGGSGENPVMELLRRIRVSHILLAINVAVFLLQGTMNGRLLQAGAKVNSEIARGQVHRLATPMFLHGSVTHLMVNSFSLYSTGPSVESWYGRARFASLYLVAGICGNVLSYFCTPTPSVGASGAIFGLVGATAVLLARHRKILGPKSRNGLNSLAYIVMVNFGMGMAPGSRIDNFGHLGGLLGGVAFGTVFGPRLIPVRLLSGKMGVIDRSLAKQAALEAKAFASRLRKLVLGSGGNRRGKR
jgi:membrane associated rhomboid family serine protease